MRASEAGALGAAVVPNSTLGVVRQLDIGPTIAKILGLELPGAMGRAPF